MNSGGRWKNMLLAGGVGLACFIAHLVVKGRFIPHDSSDIQATNVDAKELTASPSATSRTEGDQSTRNEDVIVALYNDPSTEPFKKCLIYSVDLSRDKLEDKNSGANLRARECPQQAQVWINKCLVLGGSQSYCRDIADTMASTAIASAIIANGENR